jgi:cephalosporin-C deacetylase-like acetyl esterase
MAVWKWSLACFVVIYALAICGLTIFQRRLQYFPDRRLVDPAQAGMSGVEDLRLTTDDGEMLVAWYVPAKDGHPLILYFHGNGGALVDRIPRFRALTASGYALLAVSFRGSAATARRPLVLTETKRPSGSLAGFDGHRNVLMGKRSSGIGDRARGDEKPPHSC